MDMISKVGVWQRFKTENLAEVYKLIDMEQHYDAIKDMKPTNTIEKTADGFKETWDQAGFKIITKLEGEQISIDMGKGGKDIKFKLSDIKDGWYEFEVDRVMRKHKREYVGDDEYVMHGIFTRKSDGEKAEFKEYYKRK